MTESTQHTWRLFRQSSPLPGFRLSLGFTLVYLAGVVVLPLVALLGRSLHGGFRVFENSFTSPRILASYRVTLTSALVAAVVSALFGLLVAWVLARYDFPGKSVVDALIDLPFALPTAVAGISLTTLYIEGGWIGRFLQPYNVHVVFTQLGIIVAMTFVGFPFVVRSVQPVLKDVDRSIEEAASCLGASDRQIFLRILFPTVLPALLTGSAMSFARAVGEYGSVIFIAGNLPMHTEITSLLIVTKLEEFDYEGAAAIAVVMLVLSSLVMLSIYFLQWRIQRRSGVRV